MAEIIEYFTDASFSPQNKIAVVGFKIRSNPNIQTEIIYDTKSTTAELLGIQKCIDNFCINNTSCIIYTDCSKAVMLELDYKMNNPTINLYIKKIDGHKPTKIKDDTDREFALVDKYTRKKLRQIIKTTIIVA